MYVQNKGIWLKKIQYIQLVADSETGQGRTRNTPLAVIFTSRLLSCGKVNVFTRVCLAVYRGPHVTITDDALDLS